MKIIVTVIALSCCTVSVADDSFTSTYEILVDDTGDITMPKNFPDAWTFLGTWSIAEEDVETSAAASGHGAAALHNVYTLVLPRLSGPLLKIQLTVFRSLLD